MVLAGGYETGSSIAPTGSAYWWRATEGSIGENRENEREIEGWDKFHREMLPPVRVAVGTGLCKEIKQQGKKDQDQFSELEDHIKA